MLYILSSGGSKNLEGGGGGKQFISSVLIYRKCAQQNICLLHEKKQLFEKNEPVGGGGAAPTASPFMKPPLVLFCAIYRSCDLRFNGRTQYLITSFSASVFELCGTLWDFITGLMERNNYA